MAAAAVVIAIALSPGAEGAFPGENGRIAFERDDEIYTMNSEGLDLVNLTNNGAGVEAFDGQPAWSADGTMIAFTGSRDTSGETDIFIMGADGSNVVNVTNTPMASERSPAFSPDGQTIVFSGDRDAPAGDAAVFPRSFDIYTLDLGTGTVTRLTSDLDDNGSPSFSPDGSKIIYHSASGQGSDLQFAIFLMDADRTNVTMLTAALGISERDPDFSPDGESFTFVGRSALSEIYIQNIDGTGLVALTSQEPEDGVGRPKFSPDGTKIVFQQQIGSGDKIMTMDADGSNIVNILVRPTLEDVDPSWGVAAAVDDPSSSTTNTSEPATSSTSSSTSTSSTSSTTSTTATTSTTTSTSTSTSTTSSTMATVNPSTTSTTGLISPSTGSERTASPGAIPVGEGSDQRGPLPRTGQSFRSEVAMGLAAVLLGSLLAITARRRSRTTSSGSI